MDAKKSLKIELCSQHQCNPLMKIKRLSDGSIVVIPSNLELQNGFHLTLHQSGIMHYRTDRPFLTTPDLKINEFYRDIEMKKKKLFSEDYRNMNGSGQVAVLKMKDFFKQFFPDRLDKLCTFKNCKKSFLQVNTQEIANFTSQKTYDNIEFGLNKLKMDNQLSDGDLVICADTTHNFSIRYMVNEKLLGMSLELDNIEDFNKLPGFQPVYKDLAKLFNSL